MSDLALFMVKCDLAILFPMWFSISVVIYGPNLDPLQNIRVQNHS